MPRKISPRTALAKLFDAAPNPIYAVDHEQRIVYGNPAAETWTGIPLESLVGRRVAYHSEDKLTSPGGVAAGLCPPPSVFAGKPAQGHVSCLAKSGVLVYRDASFVPLGPVGKSSQLELERDPEQVVGVVTFLGLLDLKSSELIDRSESDELHRVVRELRRHQQDHYQVASLVGKSSAMAKVRRQVQAVIASGTHVLLSGPPGSGKDHVARSIHYTRTAAADWRIATLDAASLDDSLLEWTCKPLLRDSKQPLTLILESFAQLPVAVQPMLLELFEQAVCPLQVVATSSVTASDLRQQQRLDPRLDAFLTGIVIEVPGLAQRSEDLPAIAQVFLEYANAAGGERQLQGFREDALDILMLYDWPRNLDELREVVESAHRVARSPWIRPEELPPLVHHAAADAALKTRTTETIDLEIHLADIERELIEEALKRAKGNKTQAARFLGLTRPKLYRRLVHFAMDQDEAESAAD